MKALIVASALFGFLFVVLSHVFKTTQTLPISSLNKLNLSWQNYLDETYQPTYFQIDFNVYHILVAILILASTFWFFPNLTLIFFCLPAVFMVFVYFKRRLFYKQLRQQLEELFPYLYSSLTSGLSLDRAILSASERFLAPSSHELRKMVRAQDLGISLSHCFKTLATTLHSEELQLLAFALDLSQKTGTPMSGLLENLYQQVREKREFRRKISALSSQGKTQGYVAMALPFFMLLGMKWLVPSMLSPLLETTLGHFVLGGCLAVMALASWLIYRITHMKGI